jgi:exportin-T
MEVISTVEQLQQCIMDAVDPTSTSKNVASSRINHMTNTYKDGGSLLCIQLLKEVFEKSDGQSKILQQQQQHQSQNDNLIFFALTTIQRGLSRKTNNGECIVPYEFRLELRQLIYQCVFRVNESTSSQLTIIMPIFLRKKIGIVFSQLIQIDFPQPWHSAFTELAHVCDTEKTSSSVVDILRKDLFLRVLDGFCDEVVENTSLERNTLIKDYMRGIECSIASSVPVAKSISADILNEILGIFQSNVHVMYMPRNSAPGTLEWQKLPILALSVLKRFIPWLDISLILTENNIALFFECINCAGPGDVDDDHGDGSLASQCGLEAVHCLKEIVSKGMEQEKKIELIMSTNLLQRIAESNIDFDRIDGTHINIVIKIAELVTNIGSELLLFWDTISNYTESTKDAVPLSPHMGLLMNLFFKCFSYDDIDVSGAVIPLACQILGSFQKEIQNIHVQDKMFKISIFISQLQSVMYEQMKYPLDFEFDYEDEDEAEEEVYRSELRKINQTITRISPEMSLDFLCNTLSKFHTQLSLVQTNEVEAALRLIYHYCEGIRPPPGNSTALKNHQFRNVLIALHKSDITSHPHREILILYYDIAVRYSDILQDMPELLPNVLSAISGNKGLQHDHPRVRSRSCYLLLKLVKALGSTLQPMVETAITGIQALLSNQVLSLHPDDSLYLFETIGLLLGETDLDNEQQHRYLLSVISPHIQMIDTLLRSPDLTNNIDIYGSQLAFSVAAIAFITKGFSKKQSREVKNILSQTMTPCLNILRAAPENDDVRNKIMIYLQRMIQCLGEQVLVVMNEFLQILIARCTQDDIVDVAQVFHQICLKFKANAIPVADLTILPLLQKVSTLITEISGGGQNETSLHQDTEILHFKKIIYVSLFQVVKSHCTPILLSSINLGSLEIILRTVGDGALLIPDPLIKKTCVQVFHHLSEQWLVNDNLGSDSSIVSGFRSYLLDILIPGMIRVFLRDDFNEKDASHFRVVREIAQIIYLLKSKCGLNVEQYMITVFPEHKQRKEEFVAMNLSDTQVALERVMASYLQMIKLK